MMTKLDWTHRDLSILDIRKLNKLYVIKVSTPAYSEERFESSLFVSEKIFEERLKSYFLKEVSQISRDEILNVKWNMYITQNYYIKIDQGNISKIEQSFGKWYISYLEIAGPLGDFASICKYDISHDTLIKK